MISNDEFIQKLREHYLPTITSNKRIVHYNVPAAFDIETTSTTDGNKKIAFMYVWQFGILNWVTYGRTWEEFENLIQRVRQVLPVHAKRRLIVYVQNLGYEFQFMRTKFRWDKVFFIDRNHPVYAISDGLEFRCSMKLSGKSLENIAKDLAKYPTTKKVGDLDYTKIRHHYTTLTEEELGYCEGDIRVLLHYIQEKIEQDENITNIPLTNTGYVRRYARRRCFRGLSRIPFAYGVINPGRGRV